MLYRLVEDMGDAFEIGPGDELPNGQLDLSRLLVHRGTHELEVRYGYGYGHSRDDHHAPIHASADPPPRFSRCVTGDSATRPRLSHD